MKKIRNRRSVATGMPLPGFQIAPMVDVVFVILLFFMVAIGDRQKEVANEVQLPGEPSVGSVSDEGLIRVDADGQVFLNGDPLDSPEVKDLQELASEMIDLTKTAKASGIGLVVVIQSEEAAKYDRIVNVLDALTRADVKSVSFDVLDEP